MFFFAKTPSDLSSILIFAIAFFILWAIAKNFNFFKLPKKKRVVKLDLSYVVLAFLIYLGVNLATPFLMLKIFSFSEFLKTLTETHITGIINILSNLLIAGLLFLLCMKIKREKLKKLFKEPDVNSSYLSDILTGIGTWFLTFPLIISVSHFIDYLIFLIFNVIEIPDQLAVEYLKTAYAYPSLFIIALFSILIFAPIIEELLFRGFLQTYLNSFFSRKKSILITSVIFGLFHYSPTQKFSNFTIIASLIILSLFLGFLYEKKKSLLAPISLHATFNALSIVNLFLFQGV